jgi:hypothetical protein
MPSNDGTYRTQRDVYPRFKIHSKAEIGHRLFTKFVSTPWSVVRHAEVLRVRDTEATDARRRFIFCAAMTPRSIA